ncbi:MAG TPA: heat-inducible transcription repressor HrcA [Bacteroidetes bacterium]|jgi:heat-inducible transcriptional repressor|nr:heat-inducible transcription repressor HrcA [Bacteroidota bacterium]
MAADLSQRERTVLRYIVHDFIQTATPIGSRFISKKHEDVLGLSSASIRNVMSDLEGKGYINHPHTSAGRVPTDVGYRLYCDSLMMLEQLSEGEQETIRKDLDFVEDSEMLLRESSRLLGRISHQLSIVAPPELSSGTFEKLELVHITGNRIMVIISIKSGLVRTIMMEVASEIQREKLEDLTRFLNERLSGLTLHQIRENFAEIVKDAQNEETGLISLFIDSVDKLFSTGKTDSLHISGTENIIDQPEFVNPKDFRSVIELINNKDIIVHVLQKNEARPNETRVTIGEEHGEEKLKQYSVVTSTYMLGDVTGAVGLIGPTRMAYARLIPLVDYVAKTISAMYTSGTRG